MTASANVRRRDMHANSFGGFFVPGAVFTVDVASVRHLTGLEVVLSLLGDADLLQHGVRYFVIHLGCRRSHTNRQLKRSISCYFNRRKRSQPLLKTFKMNLSAPFLTDDRQITN